MKIAAAKALAALAREDVPDEVRRLFRPAPAVRARVHRADALRSAPHLGGALGGGEGGDDSGVARRPQVDLDAYRNSSRAASIPPPRRCSASSRKCARGPSACLREGEEESVIRAALAFRANGYGTRS